MGTIYIINETLHMSLKGIVINSIVIRNGKMAELEFPKMLVPRLQQHTSNVNNECAGKSKWSKQQSSLYVTNFSAFRSNDYLNFIILILICY